VAKFGKPIIGIMGGIGSGKSFVAGLFGEMGCLVIDSDRLVDEAYRDPQVLATIRQWWGDSVFTPDGGVDRARIASRVFANPEEKSRLEALIHPWVGRRRERIMQEAAGNGAVKAYVWDVPLLVETGLHRDCDVLVWVEASREVRERRVREKRRWTEGELEKREKFQLPLDKKRILADYQVLNETDADDVRVQVAGVLSRVLSGFSPMPQAEIG
jgi:dephospho-CoA kinase